MLLRLLRAVLGTKAEGFGGAKITTVIQGYNRHAEGVRGMAG
jgi:hypothetical protein